MASSRRMPTSYNTSTYDSGDGTKDYTSLSTWEATTDIDLVSASSGEVLECYDSQGHNDRVRLQSATTNSSYFRVIKPASGEGHDGTASTGVNFDYDGNDLASTDYVFTMGEDYSQIQDIIVKASGVNDIDNVGAFFSYIYPHAGFVGCIAPASSNAGSGTYIGFHAYSAVMINCLAYGCDYGFILNSNPGWFYNCTVADCDFGFWNISTTGTAKNCISCDNTTAFYGSWSKTTCYEGDATVFADQAGDDYHLDSTDTTARGNGTDLSGDGTYDFDDDIDGETRSFWDIGADEYSAAGWAGKCLNVSSIAKINGVAVADIAKVNAVA